MKHKMVYAAALVAGSIGSLTTMALHPTGGDLLRQSEVIARRNEALAVGAHFIAILSVPVLFFGFLGFTRRLGAERPAAVAALVSYGFSMGAALCAAVINGVVAPSLTRAILEADAARRPMLETILWNNTVMNQAFSKVFVASSAIAMLLWAFAIFRRHALWNPVALVGGVVGAGSLLALLAGRVGLNVHGFGLLILAQVVWNFLVAFQIARRDGDSDGGEIR